MSDDDFGTDSIGDFSTSSDLGGSDLGSSDAGYDSSSLTSDSETTSQSWFGRLAGSLVGVLFGFVFFVVAFPVLIWNEGRAVHRAQDIDEGQTGSITLDASKLDANAEGKLVFAAHQATTEDTPTDSQFAVTAPMALRLKRTVEMYQWKETEKSETQKKVGGGETTTKTYSYSKVWSAEVIDSSRFHKSGHGNPTNWKFSSEDHLAKTIHLGAYLIPETLKSSFQNFTPIPLTDESLAGVPEEIRNQLKLASGHFFVGPNPDSPAIGNLRISFAQAPSTKCALVGMQAGETFAAYRTRGNRELFELRTGDVTKEQFFDELRHENDIFTWVIRLAGFLLMFVGIMMMLAPLNVLADVIPFVGNIVGAGLMFVAFFTAFGFSIATIAVGWLAYRPLLGGGLLLLAGLVFVLLIRRMATAKPKVAVPPPLPRPAVV